MLSSLRNFFLALFISLVVFWVSSHYLVEFIRNNVGDFGSRQDAGEEEPNSEESGTEEKNGYDHKDDPGDTSEFTALLIGIDSGLSQHDEKQEADLVILVNVNAKTGNIMVSSLSCDMRTEVKGYILRLGAVYSEFDAMTLIETVWSYTGLRINYYCVLDYESVVDVINILGDGRGIRYDVPMDMFYDPFELPEAETADELNGASAAATESQAIPAVPTEKNHESIDLKAGIQLLNGDRALQLLRYRNYANGNFGRMATQMDFLKEVLRQQMNARNLTRANEIFEKVKSSVVETNMDARTFEGYIETFFSLADFTIREIDYPGFVRNENGVAFFSPDVKSAAGLYRPFRKSADENINSIDTIDTVE